MGGHDGHPRSTWNPELVILPTTVCHANTDGYTRDNPIVCNFNESDF